MFTQTLTHRGIIHVAGEDAVSFLQGIITNDVVHVVHDAAHDKAVYACFLTPQGKYLADFFMYGVEDGILLDVDTSILSDLLKRMTLFKLRSKVTLTDVSDQYTIAAVWNAHMHPVQTNGRVFADPRTPHMGYRILNGSVEAEHGDYAAWQMQQGLADAPQFERERTTMLEANMDFLNALSWTKGCYMGQELTARTYYRGLVKKRFLPLELSGELSEARSFAADTPITRNGKTIGHVRGTIGTHVLGVVQLEALDAGHACEIDGVAATICIPDWFDLQAATIRRSPI